jgi:hypothetical protein
MLLGKRMTIVTAMPVAFEVAVVPHERHAFALGNRL